MFMPSSILNNSEISKFLIFIYLPPEENTCKFFKFQPPQEIIQALDYDFRAPGKGIAKLV